LPDAIVCVTDATNLGQHLRLAYNRQRQEEIVEEIEVILLSADLLASEESLPSTPA
jgi:F0F1-type ATP synthase gamma subunit